MSLKVRVRMIQQVAHHPQVQRMHLGDEALVGQVVAAGAVGCSRAVSRRSSVSFSVSLAPLRCERTKVLKLRWLACGNR